MLSVYQIKLFLEQEQVFILQQIFSITVASLIALLFLEAKDNLLFQLEI